MSYEFYHQLCEIYGPTVMSERIVDGNVMGLMKAITNVYDEERVEDIMFSWMILLNKCM